MARINNPNVFRDGSFSEVATDQLQEAIKYMYGCTSRLREVDQIHEEFEGKTVWDGAVHIFDIEHPKTKNCFAWTSPAVGAIRRKF